MAKPFLAFDSDNVETEEIENAPVFSKNASFEITHERSSGLGSNFPRNIYS